MVDGIRCGVVGVAACGSIVIGGCLIASPSINTITSLYTCLCTCLHTCVYTSIHMSVHMSIHIPIHTHTYMYTHVCTHVYTHVYTCLHMSEHMSTHMPIHMSICLYTFVAGCRLRATMWQWAAVYETPLCSGLSWGSWVSCG